MVADTGEQVLGSWLCSGGCWSSVVLSDHDTPAADCFGLGCVVLTVF